MPQSSSSKKLSKVETLREAARYIRHLQDLLRMSCDKPFEPMQSEPEVPSNYQTPSTSQENYYLPTSLPTDCSSYQPGPVYEQQYYLPYTSTPYCSSTYNAGFPVIKSEDPSPDSSCTSDVSVEDYRFQQKSYAL